MIQQHNKELWAILLLHTQSRIMWLFTEMLNRPDSSFQHTKTGHWFCGSTNPASDKSITKVVLHFELFIVGLKFLTSVLFWSLQQMQHNIWELNRRPQGDTVDLCYRVKLVGAGSKSNRLQLLLVPGSCHNIKKLFVAHCRLYSVASTRKFRQQGEKRHECSHPSLSIYKTLAIQKWMM